jgi:hypothetical protein
MLAKKLLLDKLGYHGLIVRASSKDLPNRFLKVNLTLLKGKKRL